MRYIVDKDKLRKAIVSLPKFVKWTEAALTIWATSGCFIGRWLKKTNYFFFLASRILSLQLTTCRGNRGVIVKFLHISAEWQENLRAFKEAVYSLT